LKNRKRFFKCVGYFTFFSPLMGDNPFIYISACCAAGGYVYASYIKAEYFLTFGHKWMTKIHFCVIIK